MSKVTALSILSKTFLIILPRFHENEFPVEFSLNFEITSYFDYVMRFGKGILMQKGI